MTPLSNPVVFVALGRGAAFWPALSAALGEYIETVGYIPVPGGFDDDFVKHEVGRVWREFLQRDPGLADVVRLNFLLCADRTGLALPALREAVERYFLKLYPAGVMADIYCLLDDANLPDDGGGRKNALEALRAGQAKGAQVYLLSNLNSANAFAPDEALCHTIALLTLFKDCVPDLYVTGADASRYNEFFFLENCAARHGRFLTAGSLILAVPRDALKALLMAELLAYGRDEPIEEEPKQPPAPEIQKKPLKSMEYLYGLAIPDVRHIGALPRRQWLARLFGQRLERLLEDGRDTAEPEPDPGDFPGEGVNFYDFLRHTSDGGFYEQAAARLAKDAEEDLRKAKERFNIWLEEMPNLRKGSPESATRRLSPLLNQDLWPYALASEYLRKQLNLQYLLDKTEALARRKLWAAKLHASLLGYLAEVDTALRAFEEQLQPLNDAFAAFMPRAADYFRQRFAEYAANNRPALAKLSKEMTGFLRRGELPLYLRRLEEYIDSHILPSPPFAKPIMDILHDLTADTAAALGEWVLQCRHLNVRLKIGYTSLYTETNLFMPAAGAPRKAAIAADVKKHYEGHGLGRMNLFAKKDANRVAILYHAGAFDLEDLYYSRFSE